MRVSLVVSNYFGCRDTVFAQVVNNTGQILGTESINDEQKEPRLYPNPADGRLFLDMNGLESEPFKYRIINLAGKVIEEGHVNSTSTLEFQVDHLASAVYFLQVVGQRKVWQLKFIKE